jgi:hypothetical protein
LRRFHIVNPNSDEPIELTPEDIAAMKANAEAVRELVNNPIALIERVRELLEGTAEPIGRFF